MIWLGIFILFVMLKEEGYCIGVVGKWYFGLGDGDLDWNEEIKFGLLEIGFDYCFLLLFIGDWVLSVYVEQYEVINFDFVDLL